MAKIHSIFSHAFWDRYIPRKLCVPAPNLFISKIEKEALRGGVSMPKVHVYFLKAVSISSIFNH